MTLTAKFTIFEKKDKMKTCGQLSKRDCKSTTFVQEFSGVGNGYEIYCAECFWHYLRDKTKFLVAYRRGEINLKIIKPDEECIDPKFIKRREYSKKWAKENKDKINAWKRANRDRLKKQHKDNMADLRLLEKLKGK